MKIKLSKKGHSRYLQANDASFIIITPTNPLESYSAKPTTKPTNPTPIPIIPPTCIPTVPDFLVEVDEAEAPEPDAVPEEPEEAEEDTWEG